MYLSNQYSTFKSTIKSLASIKGNSLAEFAVITAMMATFVMTALPKFSDVMESGKANKSIDELDKILLQAKNFYEETSALEGRGRLPGQDKFDMPVGDYTSLEEVITDLETFTTFNDPLGSKWRSVFGTDNPQALMPVQSLVEDDDRTSDFDEDGNRTCSNCPVAREKGADEWLNLFSREPLVSPFQDGHYIYTVIAGSGSGSQSSPPIIFVADLESPSAFFKKLQP